MPEIRGLRTVAGEAPAANSGGKSSCTRARATAVYQHRSIRNGTERENSQRGKKMS